MILLNKFIYFLTVVAIVQSIYLDVHVGVERCIGHELDEEDNAIFQIGAKSNNDSPKESGRDIQIKIINPEGTEIFSERIKLGSSPFDFQSNIDMRGVYEVCYDLDKGKASARAYMDIIVKSRNGLEKKKDASKKVPTDYIPTLEDELKNAEDTLNDITKEIEYARQQEVLLRQTSEKTKSRIQWFSALSILILVITSLWQIIYLRKYFTDKKIL